MSKKARSIARKVLDSLKADAGRQNFEEDMAAQKELKRMGWGLIYSQSEARDTMSLRAVGDANRGKYPARVVAMDVMYKLSGNRYRPTKVTVSPQGSSKKTRARGLLNPTEAGKLLGLDGIIR